MYRVDGSSDLTEETLDHLDGYMGSRPVRVGNAASDQLQLDLYGEAMNSIPALDNGPLDDWGVSCDLIHEQIMTKGWNDHLGAFVQYENSDVLDASLVLTARRG